MIHDILINWSDQAFNALCWALMTIAGFLTRLVLWLVGLWPFASNCLWWLSALFPPPSPPQLACDRLETDLLAFRKHVREKPGELRREYKAWRAQLTGNARAADRAYQQQARTEERQQRRATAQQAPVHTRLPDHPGVIARHLLAEGRALLADIELTRPTVDSYVWDTQSFRRQGQDVAMPAITVSVQSAMRQLRLIAQQYANGEAVTIDEGVEAPLQAAPGESLPPAAPAKTPPAPLLSREQLLALDECARELLQDVDKRVELVVREIEALLQDVRTLRREAA